MKAVSSTTARLPSGFRGACAGSRILISAVLIAGIALAQAGCQPYERMELDLESTRTAWLERSPADPSVRAFAASLERGEDGASMGEFDPSDGITLAEAEAIALVFNPGLRQARLEANVTRATAAHAGLWEDPLLGVDMERIVSGAAGANPWVVGSAIGITIPLSGRLESEKARAGSELDAELSRVAAMEWATRSALRELWMEWSAARVHASVTSELIARLRDVASVADRQEEAGSLTRIEARMFRVEIAAREADMIEVAAREMELELQLRSMLGLAPQTPLSLVPSVAFTARATSIDELRPLLETSNPEIAAVRDEYELAEQSLRTEVRKQYPDLAVGPGYGTDQGDNRVLLGLSLPLPLWNRNRQGVAEATARREVARGRFEITYEQLSSELAIALIQYESGRAQRAFIESSVVPLADQQEADVRRVAELGRVDPLLLLESLKSQYTAKIQLVEAHARESIGAVRLDELIGPPEPVDTAPEPRLQPAPRTNAEGR